MPPSSLPQEAIAAARKKLTDLRARLLDLTLRHRFLNFTHRDGAKEQLRIIDELPDQLYGQLATDGQHFFLAPYRSQRTNQPMNALPPSKVR